MCCWNSQRSLEIKLYHMYLQAMRVCINILYTVGKYQINRKDSRFVVMLFLQVIYTFIVLETTDVLWKILLRLVKDVEEELPTIELM
jgi:hypothetical protein